MQMAKHTEEALKYRKMVTSILVTMRKVMSVPLATTSSYTVMVGSWWGKHT
jgi:hypothetical protein